MIELCDRMLSAIYAADQEDRNLILLTENKDLARDCIRALLGFGLISIKTSDGKYKLTERGILVRLIDGGMSSFIDRRQADENRMLLIDATNRATIKGVKISQNALLASIIIGIASVIASILSFFG